MRVALVEMTSVPELSKNIEIIISFIETASKNKADMVLFPENCSCLAPSKIMLKYASVDQDHPVLKAAITAAKTNRIYVLLGSIAVFPNYKIRDKLQNRSLLIDKKGNVIAIYNKINMFDAKISNREIYRESDLYIAGKRISLVNTEFGTIGLTICFDLRFPELYTELSNRGANIITVPSAFTRTTGLAHWEVLLRARAIENFVWILAPAQVGNHYKNRHTWGHSMIIDPWGKIIEQNDGSKQIIYADLDIDESLQTKKVFGKL